ncbi:beta-1,4-galactosyltransferase 5-like [Amphiura filiformis]|uniref:beta-1,4-galactosyltransferase 5-like n=1 Tax=Amphiura filiformis TaxID=82378 RepID=UPI003B21AF44
MMWKALNDILPHKASPSPSSITIDDEVCTSVNDIANGFNKYFTGVAAKLVDSNGTICNDESVYVEDKPTGDCSNPVLDLPSISSEFICREIDLMSEKKATGLDDIGSKILKLAKPAILSSLVYIMNLSLRTGVFPDLWKEAKVVPLHKGGDMSINNFRPIAILPVYEQNMQPDTEHTEGLNTVCPEFDIPDLVRERKVNLSEVSLDEVELMLLGDRLNDVKRLVIKTNNLINQTRVSASTSFVSCDHATSIDQCGNNYYKEVLKSSRMLINDYMYTPGGIWTPKDCLPRWKVAIVIPYRDRPFHLPIIIRILTPMLKRQKLEFGFYVAEQANDLNFNRAMLMNVGFLEALNFSKWDCFIFHDVDHVPLSDYNYYGCSGMPRHFLSGADRWNYKILYANFFGAVTGLTRSQVFQINGFPNVYWGWGGEDDEIRMRVKEAKLDITRVKGPRGYYNCIEHHHHSAPKNKERFHLLQTFRQRLKIDGVNNLRYSKPKTMLNILYTNISVDIQQLTDGVSTVSN